METEFVPYELAVKLKPIGFDEPCLACYTENAIGRGDKLQFFVKPIKCNDDYVFVSAPTFSQAFRWFDEHTDLMGFVVPSIKDNHFDWLIRVDWEEEIECEEAYSSRIEAELSCLTKLIEIVETRTN